jgi:hypothetical protein
LFKQYLNSSNFFFKSAFFGLKKNKKKFIKNFLNSKLFFFSTFSFSFFNFMLKQSCFNFFFPLKFFLLFFFFKFLRLYYLFLLDFFFFVFRKIILKNNFIFLLFFFQKNNIFEEFIFLFKIRFFQQKFTEKFLNKKTDFFYFLRLGLLKTFNEDFFYGNFKKSKPLLFRNKVLNFLKFSEDFYLKFFFFKLDFKGSFGLFRNSLFFFFKTFFNRRLFSRSIFWFI